MEIEDEEIKKPVFEKTEVPNRSYEDVYKNAHGCFLVIETKDYISNDNLKEQIKRIVEELDTLSIPVNILDNDVQYIKTYKDIHYGTIDWEPQSSEKYTPQEISFVFSKEEVLKVYNNRSEYKQLWEIIREKLDLKETDPVDVVLERINKYTMYPLSVSISKSEDDVLGYYTRADEKHGKIVIFLDKHIDRDGNLKSSLFASTYVHELMHATFNYKSNFKNFNHFPVLEEPLCEFGMINVLSKGKVKNVKIGEIIKNVRDKKSILASYYALGAYLDTEKDVELLSAYRKVVLGDIEIDEGHYKAYVQMFKFGFPPVNNTLMSIIHNLLIND